MLWFDPIHDKLFDGLFNEIANYNTNKNVCSCSEKRGVKIDESGKLTATLEVVGKGKEDVSVKVIDGLVKVKVEGWKDEVTLCEVADEYDATTYSVTVKNGLLTFTAEKKPEVKNEITLEIQ